MTTHKTVTVQERLTIEADDAIYLDDAARLIAARFPFVAQRLGQIAARARTQLVGRSDDKLAERLAVEMSDRRPRCFEDLVSAIRRGLARSGLTLSERVSMEGVRAAIESERRKWFCSGADCEPFDHGRDEGFEFALKAFDAALNPTGKAE